MFELPTPSLILDAEIVRRNLRRMADYTQAHGLALRPHTKTHKSRELGAMQLREGGAMGLTVAKIGEAKVMASITKDLLLAYPVVDPRRAEVAAHLARDVQLRVAIDSAAAAQALGAAAMAADSSIGILVDLDVGLHRTGVQTPQEALSLAQLVDSTAGLRLDGLFFFPGHLPAAPPKQIDALLALGAVLGETLELWSKSGLQAAIVSGGSTPSALNSHHIGHLTEIRPGTYIFNDMNCVHGGSARLEDCAARIVATVVSTAVPGQVVLDAGSKTLTSDLCGPAPTTGHGYIVEYPQAKIVKLSEEHAQVDVTQCNDRPQLGAQVTIVPNHICPCVNLQDQIYWLEPGKPPRAMPVDARGRVF
ncbi:MAG: alanine racemase [Planctomycetes bacterium]|nr:alanine racemase [Planctomycetota bacterium]